MIDAWKSTFAVQPGSNPGLLVLCDHASNAIPDEYEQLGLCSDALRRHIAWDPGALGVAKALADRFDAELIHCGTSRILIDANRAPEHADLIMDRSDGVHVPGNQRVDAQERLARLQRFHDPYHQRIAQTLDARISAGQRPLLLAIHSFEPVFAGLHRPWPIGVLWKLERRPLQPIFESLAAHGIKVGDNQPYDGHFAMGYTLEHHAIGRGLPHLMFELRNDEIVSAEQQALWASRVATAMLAARMLEAS